MLLKDASWTLVRSKWSLPDAMHQTATEGEVGGRRQAANTGPWAFAPDGRIADCGFRPS